MNRSSLPRLCGIALLWLTGCLTEAQAGGEGSMEFVRTFLERHPSFKAEGVMTSTLSDHKAPYRCRIEIDFTKPGTLDFRYNTDAARHIIPYDFVFAQKKLTETIYNRERSEILSRKELGAPTRTLFNFVADLLGEAEKGAGLKSLLFNGLMSVSESESSRRTQITLERRLPIIPIKTVHFTFDDDLRLRGLHILQADGSEHRLEVRRFRSTRPPAPPEPNPES